MGTTNRAFTWEQLQVASKSWSMDPPHNFFAMNAMSPFFSDGSMDGLGRSDIAEIFVIGGQAAYKEVWNVELSKGNSMTTRGRFWYVKPMGPQFFIP